MNYRLELTADEHKTLAWVADRYDSASVLYDGMVKVEDANEDGWGGLFDVAEEIAWQYEEELGLENGGGLLVPPCVGGTLAEKLIEFQERIV